MLDFPRWKVWSISLGLLLLILLAVPSFVPETTRDSWPSWVPKPAINLGLDLAGGSYLLLEAQTDDVAKVRLDAMRDNVKRELNRATIQTGDIAVEDGKLTFMVSDPTQVDAAREKLLPLTNGVATTGQRDWKIEVIDGSRFVLTPTPEGIQAAIKQAMGDATENVRNRINSLGTREPTILQQGDNRIVVQVPGLKDPKRLKDLLGTTGKLEFKMVDLNAVEADIAQGNAPFGSVLAKYPNGLGARATAIYRGQPTKFSGVAVKPGDILIALDRQTLISGDQLSDARAEIDSQTNQWQVSLTFNSAGARKFAQATAANVGKPFAIVVDGVVISAPNINEPIPGGQARISGGFTADAANNLAIALRSGKLPVPLKVIAESTVSPELGQDSINAGVTASIIATVAVIAFMILTYGRFGIYSTFAVVINVLVILGMMSLLNATLTLPGIAGFVLTIGTAVDANVLINERIREERRRGRSVIQSLELGYKEASRTIFEANVTHAIAGLIMLLLGSGPIRGFAIVLLIGIATSVFTAVTFTRMLVAIWVRRARPTEIHI